MGKTSKPRTSKPRPKKYETKLAIKGTLDDVLNVAVKSAKKDQK